MLKFVRSVEPKKIVFFIEDRVEYFLCINICRINIKLTAL